MLLAEGGAEALRQKEVGPGPRRKMRPGMERGAFLRQEGGKRAILQGIEEATQESQRASWSALTPAAGRGLWYEGYPPFHREAV